MIKKLFILSIIFALSDAQIIFSDIQTKPSGRAKNFMIWQYLKQDITSKEADSAYSLVEGNIYKINKAYLKKSKNKILLRKAECRNNKNLLSINEEDCFKLAMSLYKTLRMDSVSRKKLLKRLQSKSARDAVKIQAEPYLEKAYISYEANTIIGMFLNVGTPYRRENLNLKLSHSFIKHMFSQNASRWRSFAIIKKIVNDDKLNNLQESLLLLKGQYVDSDANFLLGLNQLKYNNPKEAIKNFELAKKFSSKQMDKDKNTFWMYQASKDIKYLKDLSLSKKINIYTQYANEKLNIEVSNYFTSVKVVDIVNKDICSPFIWNSILKEIRQTPQDELLQLAKKYNQKNMAAVQAFIIQKAYSYKTHAFIMPYDEYLEDVSKDNKALVYALMRQESQLIPSALSRSFALGLMQIMPFVTDDLSKKMKNPITCYDDMFIPKENIKYALKHLKWLQKTYYHPLFVAYAYNGGLGYFRRHLKAGTFLKGKYEPFMSMELMSNTESREYGKKVLSNYVMYKKILGEKISISDLLHTLTNPKKTDRYRSQG